MNVGHFGHFYICGPGYTKAIIRLDGSIGETLFYAVLMSVPQLPDAWIIDKCRTKSATIGSCTPHSTTTERGIHLTHARVARAIDGNSGRRGSMQISSKLTYCGVYRSFLCYLIRHPSAHDILGACKLINPLAIDSGEPEPGSRLTSRSMMRGSRSINALSISTPLARQSTVRDEWITRREHSRLCLRAFLRGR